MCHVVSPVLRCTHHFGLSKVTYYLHRSVKGTLMLAGPLSGCVEICSILGQKVDREKLLGKIIEHVLNSN
jgi:hypothetical protein